jgi:hypothetical protein
MGNWRELQNNASVPIGSLREQGEPTGNKKQVTSVSYADLVTQEDSHEGVVGRGSHTLPP